MLRQFSIAAGRFTTFVAVSVGRLLLRHPGWTNGTAALCPKRCLDKKLDVAVRSEVSI